MKYRIKPYDRIHDIYYVQKRVLWIFWRSIEVGNKAEAEKLVKELNDYNRYYLRQK